MGGQDVERKFNLQNFTLNLAHVDAFDRQRVLRKCDATVSIEDVDASIKRCSDKLENVVTMTAIGVDMDRYKYAKACRISFEKYLYELYKQLYILEHTTPTGEPSASAEGVRTAKSFQTAAEITHYLTDLRKQADEDVALEKLIATHRAFGPGFRKLHPKKFENW